MTAKEQLLKRVQAYSEAEAADALRVLDQRGDSLTRLLENAAEDDEPVTAEEEALVAEANADIAAGRIVSIEEILTEFGD